MTHSPPTDPGDGENRHGERISFLSGQWIPHWRMHIGVDDLGFRQGVTAVERMRTYNGNVFALDRHLDRWRSTLAELAIDQVPSAVETKSLVGQLLDKNAEYIGGQETGVTMFATAGQGDSASQTFGLHLNGLDHDRIKRRCNEGQPLVLTEVRQPDPLCWPRTIKTRCRIHYYLADRVARLKDPEAVGVLLDHDGTITETSIANLAIVCEGRLLSPPADRVLPGITQSIIEELASSNGLTWVHRPIAVDEIRAAEEVLMMGTGAGIWFASSVDDQAKTAGGMYRKLRQQFDDLTRATGSRLSS